MPKLSSFFGRKKPVSELEAFLDSFAKPSADGSYDRNDAAMIDMHSRSYRSCFYLLQTPYGWLSAAYLEIAGETILDQRLHPDNGFSLTPDEASNRALFTIISCMEDRASKQSEMPRAERDAYAAKLISQWACANLKGVEEIEILDEESSYPLVASL